MVYCLGEFDYLFDWGKIEVKIILGTTCNLMKSVQYE